MKNIKIVIGILCVVIALWYGVAAIVGLFHRVHYYYLDQSPGTEFYQDGVRMTWYRVFLPVLIYGLVATVAAWAGLKLLGYSGDLVGRSGLERGKEG